MSEQAKAAAVPKFASFKRAVVKRSADSEQTDPGRPQPHDAQKHQPSRSALTKRRRSVSPSSLHRGHGRGHDNRTSSPAHDSPQHRPPPRSHRHERLERPESALIASSLHADHVQPTGHASSTRTSSRETSQLYTVDTKGDVQNWAYQRLHKYAIPQYRRSGYGNVLGLALRYKIDKATSLEDKVQLVDTIRRSATNTERALLKRPTTRHTADLRLSSLHQDTPLDHFANYIPLRNPRNPPSHIPGSLKPDLFANVTSLHVTASPNPDPDDPDLVYISSDDEHDALALDDQARRQNAELSRAAKSNPASLQLWLDLVAHQQFLVRPGVPDADPEHLSNTERRSLADLRLHIIDKALKAISIQDKNAREVLFSHMFREALAVWDTDKYLPRLDAALRELPTSLSLRKMYLDAALSDPARSRFEEGKLVFLQSLRNVNPDASAEHAQDVYLYILLRYTTYLRETGFEELSVATWQALFEFHQFRPQETTIGTDMTIVWKSFEDFWDSETPRFAELNAHGWRHYGSAIDAQVESTINPPESDLNHAHPFKSFVACEQSMSNAFSFPGRTTDDTPSDDPFHIVFFSDIKDVLEAIPLQLSLQGLTDAFLCYVGLPTLPVSATTIDHSNRARTWQIDTALAGGWLGGHASADHKVMTEHPTLHYFQNSVLDLFSHSFLPRSAFADHELLERVLLSVRCALELLVRSFAEEEGLTEYYLAFMCHYFSNEASKVARTTLKRQSSSLRLYNACALVESALGKSEKAAHVWSGAIRMKEKFHAQAQQDVAILWQNWTWSEMQQGDPQHALSRLISFDGSLGSQPIATVASSSATLRVKKAFREGFAHACSNRNAQLASSNAECVALLAYMSQSDALMAAIGVLQEYCAQISGLATSASASMTMELLHQAKARIIRHHIKQRQPYRPADVRSTLENSIDLFPNNTMFLSLYRENEARFRIDDRVRAILKDDGAADKRLPLIRFSLEVDQEMSRFSSQVSGSTAESVRATFSRALLANSSQVRNSEFLWARWLRFESDIVQLHAMGQSSLEKRRRLQAVQHWKQVFLGGLHHLPWSKAWILHGLDSFDSEQDYGWTLSELRRLYNLLHEREFRVRVEGVEDLLDDIAEGRHSSSR